MWLLSGWSLRVSILSSGSRIDCSCTCSLSEIFPWCQFSLNLVRLLIHIKVRRCLDFILILLQIPSLFFSLELTDNLLWRNVFWVKASHRHSLSRRMRSWHHWLIILRLDVRVACRQRLIHHVCISTLLRIIMHSWLRCWVFWLHTLTLIGVRIVVTRTTP